MRVSITVSLVKIDNEPIEKIMISGAAGHEEAIEAAEEWCRENNFILLSKNFEDPIRNEEDTSSMFYAKIYSDSSLTGNSQGKT